MILTDMTDYDRDKQTVHWLKMKSKLTDKTDGPLNEITVLLRFTKATSYRPQIPGIILTAQYVNKGAV